MKIVIDARPLSHPQAGGFRSYVRALMRGLAERDIAGLDLLLYVDRELTAEDRAFVPPGAGVRVLTPNRMRSDLVEFPRAVREDSPDLVHGTMNYLPQLGSTQTVLTVHDAIGVKRYPWAQSVPRTPRERFINHYWSVMTRLSARAARHIITDSQGAAAELAEALHLPRDRFTVVYPGILAAASRQGKGGDEVSQNNVLAIASPDPRKNIDLLYRALSQETRRFPGGIPPHLNLVCSSDVSAQRAEDAVSRYGLRKVRFLRGLDDAALRDAYSSSGAFVWPSFREGFGLPPLEAMSCRCPVAASRAPVMPEVLGDAPLYFDPDDPADLAGALAHLLCESPKARQARLLVGQERAERFSCSGMANNIAAVWKAQEAAR
jgi:glycosyltransferase involved in cell wall biosynthesis